MRNSEYSRQVAEEIRVLLARKSLTQTELATRASIGSGTLSRKIRGLDPFLVTEVERIARALQVDVTDIMPSLKDGEAA